MHDMAKYQEYDSEREHIESIKQRRSLKALLKEEEPQKIGKIIDKIESSREKVDEFVSRITGIEARIITTARNWHKIIKKVIIEDGKEILESVLKELEQELRIANEIKKQNSEQGLIQKTKEKEEIKEKPKHKIEEDEKAESSQESSRNTLVEVDIKNTEHTTRLSNIDNTSKKNKDLDMLIIQELEFCKKKVLAQSKTAVKILLDSDKKSSVSPLQENTKEESYKIESLQKKQSQEKERDIKLEDISSTDEEEIFMDIELLPSDFLSSNTESQKDGEKKEYYKKRDSLEELKGISLEESTWAPKESTCREVGEYKAKIAAALLPGNTKEERLKFVKGTLYKSSHIIKIEECFAKGNPWIVISMDCLKGVEILKEKLKRKEIEWYKVIFEDTQLKSSLPTERKIKSIERNKSAVKAEASTSKEKPMVFLQQKYQEGKETMKSSTIEESKGKNRDFTWVSLWDLPSDYSKGEIRRALKHLGRVEEIRTQRYKFFQVAEAKIFTKSEEQIRKIKANWVIGLENGKLARITTGNINKEDLRKREGCRATLIGVPSSAQEILLLRALRATGAKAVYMPYNSNRNPSCVAKVFFETEEDMKKALNRNIYYFNTKLSWKERMSSFEKEYRERRTFVKQREIPLSKGIRAASPRQSYRKRENTRFIEESRTQSADTSRDAYQRKQENDMALVLNKLLNRMEILEVRWENSQRPQKSEDPNRS
jgi:hypothetical protein